MKAKIMVVDDARFMRLILGGILREADCKVVAEASNGKQAIDLYKKLKPDLVTMDIVMPEMGGVEAVRQIIEFDPNAKIIMVSAMGQQELVTESMDAGACDFVVKPFVSDDVLKKVTKALSSSYVESK